MVAVGEYTWGSTPVMVADVQAWLDNPTTNFGWLLQGNEIETSTTKRFASKEHATAELRPQLLVSFIEGAFPTATPTHSTTNTPIPTLTPTLTNTLEPTDTATQAPSDTHSPTRTNTSTQANTPTPTNTFEPGVPTPTRDFEDFDVEPEGNLDGFINAHDLINWFDRLQTEDLPQDLLFDFSRFWYNPNNNRK